MRVRRSDDQMRADANRILEILTEYAKEKPTYGKSLIGLADDLDWEEWETSKVASTIGFIRNRMEQEGAFIACFQSDGRYYYSIPTSKDEAQVYANQRLHLIRSHVVNVLWMVQKIQQRWGGDRATRLTIASLTGIIGQLDALSTN